MTTRRATTRAPGRLLAALGVTVVLAVGLTSTAPPAAAAARSGPVDVALPAEALGDLAPELAGVPVEGAQLHRAHDVWSSARRMHAASAAARADAERRLVELTAARDLLAEQLRSRQRAHAQAASDREGARRRLVGLAVAAFVADDPAARMGAALAGIDDGRRREEVFGDVAETSVSDDLRRADEALRVARHRLHETADALAEVESAHQSTEAERARAEAEERRWAAATERSLADLVVAARRATVAGTDLSVLALDAYWRASRTSCTPPWHVLAGIGRVESRHGTYRGARPDDAGTVRPPIIGIPLDGTRQTLHVRDTDGGSLDGDTAVDRAVGPMQFIPSTWRSFRADGNADGRADPQNLYDAAAAAAAYLCRTGVGADPARAVFAYNHSEAYVATVLGHAAAYQRVPIPAA